MIDGSILIGARDARRDSVFHGVEAATGRTLPQGFAEATTADVAEACALAEAASAEFGAMEPARRATFMEAVASAIDAIGDILITTAMAETGLPRARLEHERGRTTGQMRLLATEVRDGVWIDAVIDPALPERRPPRVDLRRMNLPLGPVAVFGASNFPLAYSAGGGDTAAAFAAGCPVVVKGHPAHPGTGELVARAVRAAAQAAGLHEGVYSYLPGSTHALGAALVADPRIKAVGFTGSRVGGLALLDIAQRRPEPIPVFAEMSSINPVVFMPAALASNAAALATAFVASLSSGAGQFCTNPGLVLALDGPDLDAFMTAAATALDAVLPQVMLTPHIRGSYEKGVAALDDNASARRIGTGALFTTTAAAFIADPSLGHEVFGVASVIVRCADLQELARVIDSLEGQLTATLHAAPADALCAAPILAKLQAKAGRVIANGWPTGVEVTHAMVHGGPFPATSDGRTTSVGTLAMMRFLRPVCFQNMPDALLPPPLQATNPWGIPRRVDGRRQSTIVEPGIGRAQ